MSIPTSLTYNIYPGNLSLVEVTSNPYNFKVGDILYANVATGTLPSGYYTVSQIFGSFFYFDLSSPVGSAQLSKVLNVDYYVKNPQNISSFSRLSTGRYILSFTTAYSDEDYVVNATARGRATNDISVAMDSSAALSQSSFQLAVIQASTGSSIDAERVMFTVF
jgi:hypothetical protein